jgi:chitodextrinase
MKNSSFTAIIFALLLTFAGCETGTEEEDVPDTVPPADVTGLSGTVGSGQVTLTWTDPADSDLDHIEITFVPAVGDQPRRVAKGVKTIVITGLTDGTEYTFTVKAVDAAGNKSAGTNKTCKPHIPDATAPGDVSNMKGTAGNGQVTLTWNDPADSDLEYIEITFAPPAEGVTQPVNITGGTETATIAGLSNGTAYTFTLRAVDESGNKSSGLTGSACTPQDPGAVITVNNYEELRLACLSTKTIQLVAVTYQKNDYMLYIPDNSDITILPPPSGTATIKMNASFPSVFISVGENTTLRMGKEGAASGSLVIDGNASNPFIYLSHESAHFIMEDGVSLMNNREGAVNVNKGLFEMKGGLIANNRTSSWGAGVSVSEGEFIMEGGIISGNVAENSGDGGGVSVGFLNRPVRGRFTMKGGRIMRNTAGGYGGGVYVRNNGTFVMEGGTIHGYHASDGDSNRAGASGTNGAAVYVQYGGIAQYGNGTAFPQSTNRTIEL